MIAGIGTDIVEVARIERLWQRHSDGAPRRILAAAELNDYAGSNDPARFLAKRFAVKEALAKALGTGVRAPVLLTSIALMHDSLGRPYFQFSAELQSYLDSRQIKQHHVSLSDERLYVLAFVVLETTAPVSGFNQ